MRNPAWGKVSFFSAVLFLTLLADAILSYWVPNFLDSVYKNSASVNLYLATLHHWLFLILLSMAVWGIYYELLGFAQHQFVADAIPLKLHSGAWGVLGVARSTAYFVSPLIGGGAVVSFTGGTFVGGLGSSDFGNG